MTSRRHRQKKRKWRGGKMEQGLEGRSADPDKRVFPTRRGSTTEKKRRFGSELLGLRETKKANTWEFMIILTAHMLLYHIPPMNWRPN